MNPPNYPPPMPAPATAGSKRKRRKSGPRVATIVVAVIALLGVGGFVAYRMMVAREIVSRVECAKNLHQIGQALSRYASINQGHLPPTLSALVPGIAASAINCPRTNKPFVFAAPNMDISAYLPQAQRKLVLVYEPVTNHEEGINILWGNGEVEWDGSVWGQQVIDEINAGHNPPQVVGLTTASSLGPPSR